MFLILKLIKLCDKIVLRFIRMFAKENDDFKIIFKTYYF